MGPKDTEFGEITQNKGHYAVQGHLRSPILVPNEMGLLLVITTNLPPILHRFRDMADYWSIFALTPSLGVTPCEYPDTLYFCRN